MAICPGISVTPVKVLARLSFARAGGGSMTYIRRSRHWHTFEG